MKAETLKEMIDPIVAQLRHKLGTRASIVIMVGAESDDPRHDVYYQNATGPCLVVKGLVAQCAPEIEAGIKFTSKV